jgi:hypothetical protein
MKTTKDLSNLLITAGGVLILKSDRDFEVMGVRETGGDLSFKVRH